MGSLPFSYSSHSASWSEIKKRHMCFSSPKLVFSIRACSSSVSFANSLCAKDFVAKRLIFGLVDATPFAYFLFQLANVAGARHIGVRQVLLYPLGSIHRLLVFATGQRLFREDFDLLGLSHEAGHAVGRIGLKDAPQCDDG